MKKPSSQALLLLSVVVLTAGLALRTCIRTAEKYLSKSTIAGQIPAQPPRDSITAPETPVRRVYASGPVDWTAFGKRFQLTQVDTYKLRSALGLVVRDFVERRGAVARVDKSDGDFFTVTLPELPLTDAQIDESLLLIATRVVGEQKAIEILSDPEGFSALAKYTSLGEMQIPRQFALRKMSTEGLKDMTNPWGYARFEIAISTYDAERRAMVLRITHRGFSYTEADTIGLGWNAMAKAPAGYFRSEPILGAASKPRPMPVVTREVGSDTFEVLNERGPGLSETITTPPGR